MYTTEHIDKLAARLKEAPALPKAMTSAEAIKKLAPSIRAMQAKGYSLDQVADTLKAEGMDVSGKTLARHLRGSKPGSGGRKAQAGSASDAHRQAPWLPPTV